MFAWSQTLIDPVREFGFAGAVIRAFRLSRTLCSMTKFQRLVMKILVLPSAIRNRGRTGRMLLSEGSSSVENRGHAVFPGTARVIPSKEWRGYESAPLPDLLLNTGAL
jgi:hypothetical protein